MTAELALTIALSDEQLEQLAALFAPRVAAPSPTSPWLNVPEAAEYLRSPKSRIYALASVREIPVHRDGSRLLFHRDELDAWIRDGGGKRP